MSHSSKLLRVLHIEDSQADSQLIEKCLSSLNFSISLHRISSKKELKNSLARQGWDLILADYETAGLMATDALSIVRKNDPDVPFILVSRPMGEDKVAALMKSGIEDVVLKSRLERLNSVVRRAMREHDIRNKEARAHRHAFEAFAAKEQMLAIVSHDIKNPLSAVQLEVQTLLKSALQEESHLAQDVRIQSARILKITERMKTLIADLLDNNKGENRLTKLTKTDVDPSNLFYEVVDSLRPLIQEKEIVLQTTLPEHGVLICMDRNKMFQVFCNLLTNAIKFTPYGGSIHFELTESPEGFVLKFTDSGGGLPQEDRRKVFEKYWTGNKKEGTGSGLGLFICKTIIEAHGGSITAENEKGAGASFILSLPKDHATLVSERPHHAHNEAIMVIDDDDDLREVVTWALSKEGFHVEDYKKADEALKDLSQGKLNPSLILIDQNMEGMKGDEFLSLKQKLKSKNKFCPTMLMSGSSAADIEQEVSSDLYEEILEKPLDLEGLIGKVKKHMKGGSIDSSSLQH